MKVSLFYLPSIGSRRGDRAAAWPACAPISTTACSPSSAEQARLADDLGYDSISFTEHHFHIEGFELSNNPVLLDLFVAMQTQRIRVGQLGIVLPAHNPIRVAEDIAMLDHMSGGRANAGFARGYQRRWVDVMAQQTHGIHGALPHQHDAIDAANRAAFEECFRIIKRAWTEELLSYDGRYWRIPAGATPWDLGRQRRYGAGVDDGVVRAVGVVPKPLQKPHPPLFQPFASSERSIRWCARGGRHRDPAAAPPDARSRSCSSSTPRSRDGRSARGSACCATSSSPIPTTRRWRSGTTAAPSAAQRGSSRSASRRAWSIRRPAPCRTCSRDGLVLVGSVDTVTRQLERLLERVPRGWLFAWLYNGFLSNDRLKEDDRAFLHEGLATSQRRAALRR